MVELYNDNTKESDIILPEIITIPEISDNKLRALYKKLKPIVTVDELKYLIKRYTLQEMRTIAYTWYPEKDIEIPIDMDGLEPVEDYLCFHECINRSWHGDGKVKPFISEVLAQAPKDTVKYANFFEIIEEPKTNADLAKFEKVYYKNNMGLTKVRSYRLKNAVKNQYESR